MIYTFVNFIFQFLDKFDKCIEKEAEDIYEPAVLDWNNASLVFGNFGEHRLRNIEMGVGWVAPSPIVTS